MKFTSSRLSNIVESQLSSLLQLSLSLKTSCTAAFISSSLPCHFSQCFRWSSCLSALVNVVCLAFFFFICRCCLGALGFRPRQKISASLPGLPEVFAVGAARIVVFSAGELSRVSAFGFFFLGLAFPLPNLAVTSLLLQLRSHYS